MVYISSRSNTLLYIFLILRDNFFFITRFQINNFLWQWNSESFLSGWKIRLWTIYAASFELQMTWKHPFDDENLQGVPRTRFGKKMFDFSNINIYENNIILKHLTISLDYDNKMGHVKEDVLELLFRMVLIDFKPSI